MGIDNEIEKMEETLRKKKLMRTEKGKARIIALRERVKTKTAMLEKVKSEIGKLEAEVEEVKARMGTQSGMGKECGNAETEATTRKKQ